MRGVTLGWCVLREGGGRDVSMAGERGPPGELSEVGAGEGEGKEGEESLRTISKTRGKIVGFRSAVLMCV